jgi:NTE family protein
LFKKNLKAKIPYKKLISIIFALLLLHKGYSQQVGVVLSGGGATGLAHIGVLKALEENDIPIDYITGTSSGALIGALYAAGYSPDEIEAIVLDEDFQLMMKGKVESEFDFALRKEENTSSMFDIGFKLDSVFAKTLPTKWITPALLDYLMLKLLGTTGASKSENFDSLFVPFRCVASDISKKKLVIFRSGKLNEAVRASMTYPFFIPPIRVNGKLLFDGGLYNNFPADILYNELNPDYIIGSNVSDNEPPPTADDLLSQLKNMLVSKTNFELPCDAGLIINPVTSISTFEFSKAAQAIQSGYDATMRMMDSIKQHVSKRISKTVLAEQRAQFRKSIVPLNINRIRSVNEKGKPSIFVNESFFKKRKANFIDENRFKHQYFWLYGTPQISYLYPLLDKANDSSYNLSLSVQRSKEFRVFIGGHFCTRAVTTGYLGFSYYSIGRAAFTAHIESYFGKFYNSAKANLDFSLPSRLPISIHPYVVLNRWDYFKSFASFFQEIKPSFLVQNEIHFGARFSAPVSTTVKTSADFRAFYQKNQYYQTSNFTKSDTADITYFDGINIKWSIENSSLNRKQFASKGHYFKFQARYVTGREESVSGSTSPTDYDVYKQHQWLSLSLEARYYFLNFNFTHTGFHFIGEFTSQSLFKNYTATLLNTPAFQPTPDSRTIFLSEYRSPQFVGLGINQVFTIKDKFDFRADIYGYQPFREIENHNNGTFGYSKGLPLIKWLASASAIYHSPIGPLRLTFNYFPYQANPYLVQLSFGYIFFNERSIR